MADEEEEKCVCPDGIPAWVMTFADLMSLLMCFFVLLLSFSEMDVMKYKQIAGSLRNAFGVQRVVRAHEIPKGTSIIAHDFSPGKPEPTVVSKVNQVTSNTQQKNLNTPDSAQLSTEVDARKIAKNLKKEISQGKVEVESSKNKIIIRIQEKGSFKSGSAELNKKFLPVIHKIYLAIKDINGDIKIAGHTDNNPISTQQFQSNWALSAARAVSVAQALMANGELHESRFEISGYGDTRPRVPNTSDDNRAKNRRVVITIMQHNQTESEDDPQEKVNKVLKGISDDLKDKGSGADEKKTKDKSSDAGQAEQESEAPAEASEASGALE